MSKSKRKIKTLENVGGSPAPDVIARYAAYDEHDICRLEYDFARGKKAGPGPMDLAPLFRTAEHAITRMDDTATHHVLITRFEGEKPVVYLFTRDPSMADELRAKGGNITLIAAGSLANPN